MKVTLEVTTLGRMTPLRQARLDAGMTLNEVAQTVGLTKASLSRIETGRQRPSPEIAEALARFFGTVSEMEILYPERFRKGRAAA